jgi:hypothetical protein
VPLLGRKDENTGLLLFEFGIVEDIVTQDVLIWLIDHPELYVIKQVKWLKRYKSIRPFVKYVVHFYELKKNIAAEMVNHPERKSELKPIYLFVKKLLNSLYGIWGIKTRKQKKIVLSYYKNDWTCNILEGSFNIKHKIPYKTQTFLEYENLLEIKEKNILMASDICSNARLHLFKFIYAVVNEPYCSLGMCDTDSLLFFTLDKNRFIRNVLEKNSTWNSETELGGFKNEVFDGSEIMQVVLVNCKVYALVTSKKGILIKFKGFSQRLKFSKKNIVLNENNEPGLLFEDNKCEKWFEENSVIPKTLTWEDMVKFGMGEYKNIMVHKKNYRMGESVLVDNLAYPRYEKIEISYTSEYSKDKQLPTILTFV